MAGPAPCIAIDGPVGSGKTAVGRRLAERLGYMFLDTGVMYRAVTLLALRRGVCVDDPEALTALAGSIGMDIVAGPAGDCRVVCDAEDVTDALREPEVERAVSAVSSVPGVRAVLVTHQREIAERGNIVMAGRDIGTIVLPDARLKVYLDASANVRAGRRVRERREAGDDVTFDTVLGELERRDELDSTRSVAPLRPAADAHQLATDGLDLEQVVDRLEALARGDGGDG